MYLSHEHHSFCFNDLNLRLTLVEIMSIVKCIILFQILEKAFKGVCSEQDANIWLRCTSAGNQDVDCCKKEKVVGCENLCNGRFSILEMMTCINAHLQPLLQCHKDALLNAR